MNLVITHHWLEERTRLRAESSFCWELKGWHNRQQSTASARPSIRAAGPSAVAAICRCSPEMTTPCNMQQRSLSPNTSEHNTLQPGRPACCRLSHLSRKICVFLFHEMKLHLSACLANHLNMSCGEFKYKVQCFTEDVWSQSDI